MLNVLAEEGANSVLEVGIGSGNAIPLLAGAGLDVAGLEIDDELVRASRERMSDLGLDPEAVVWEGAAQHARARATRGMAFAGRPCRSSIAGMRKPSAPSGPGVANSTRSRPLASFRT
jgi:SAM-dependent methyltransferase